MIKARQDANNSQQVLLTYNKGSVAQLNRASDSGSAGHGFESHPSHKIYCFRHSKKVKWLMVCRKGKAYSLNNGSIGHFSFNE